MALAKRWRALALAVDVDAVAVRVARENIRRNQLHPRMRAVCGDGYCSPEVRREGPFDLIVANILARPLIQMAPALASALKPGGTAILSGLLVRQERAVLAAHLTQGLFLLRRVRRDGWSTLVLARRGGRVHPGMAS